MSDDERSFSWFIKQAFIRINWSVRKNSIRKTMYHLSVGEDLKHNLKDISSAHQFFINYSNGLDYVGDDMLMNLLRIFIDLNVRGENDKAESDLLKNHIEYIKFLLDRRAQDKRALPILWISIVSAAVSIVSAYITYMKP